MLSACGWCSLFLLSVFCEPLMTGAYIRMNGRIISTALSVFTARRNASAVSYMLITAIWQLYNIYMAPCPSICQSSSGSLVFPTPKVVMKFQLGSPQRTGDAKCSWGKWNSVIFDHYISIYIENVQYRRTNHLYYTFWVFLNISGKTEDKVFKFCTQVSHQVINCGCPYHFFGTEEARHFKFGTQNDRGEY